MYESSDEKCHEQENPQRQKSISGARDESRGKQRVITYGVQGRDVLM